MNNNFIHIILKGMCVGSTMLIPGVSGGSMAMILGIYDKLISSVSSFLKHKKESALFLGLFLLGGIVGILLFARPMEYLLKHFTITVMYFFIGTAAGGMPQGIYWLICPVTFLAGYGAIRGLTGVSGE